MANTCITTYAAIGDKDAVARLKADLLAAKDPEDPESRSPWLGHFLKHIGLDPGETLDRCGWLDLWTMENKVDETADGRRLDFVVESKWSRCEYLEEIIPERYGVELYFMEEELGCEIFNTNDTEHTVFPEYIIVDSDDEGMEYHTAEGAKEALKALLEDREEAVEADLDAMTVEQMKAFVDETFDDIWMHVAQAA